LNEDLIGNRQRGLKTRGSKGMKLGREGKVEEVSVTSEKGSTDGERPVSEELSGRSFCVANQKKEKEHTRREEERQG